MFKKANREDYLSAARIRNPIVYDRLLKGCAIRGSTECWNWEKGLSGGYGTIKIEGKQTKTHRLSFELFNNEKIPEGLCVLHSCDNPACLNPSHLRLGTHKDNMNDRDRRGRNGDIRGSKNGRAKLTEEEALDIKKSGELSYILSKRFNISQVTVAGIRRGAKWKHLN